MLIGSLPLASSDEMLSYFICMHNPNAKSGYREKATQASTIREVEKRCPAPEPLAAMP
jgi:hypothetical protein